MITVDRGYQKREINWLDSDGKFLLGKHKGSLAERVVTTDHSYIQWLVDNVENMNEEDREILFRSSCV